MATDSEDFLQELDELLSDTNENEDIPGKQKEDNSIEGFENMHIQDNEDQKRNENGLESPNAPGVMDISTALERNESVEVIRQLCAGGVPSEMRGGVWRSVLGVKKRPDAIGTWEGPLDYENQTLIHKQCQEQAGEILSPPNKGDAQSVASTLEQVITFYCKSRNIAYREDSGMVELLGPLASSGLSKGDLFNCLYVLLSKYIPKDCRVGGRPFDLFRLLILYHDPELCSILDTRKLLPELYLQQWLRSLFSNHCSLPVLNYLWDQYFMERDPFLVFFLSLVLVINAKELILKTPPSTPVEDIVAMVISLPRQLTVEDIPDFVSLAQYYSSQTPQSFRKDYHNLLFGSSRTLSSVNSGILCLPVHIQEIFDSTSDESQQGLTYFLVDCRPLSHVSVGHLPKAMHLDTDLLLHSPQDFAVSMKRLNDRVQQSKTEGGEHLCFMGSGRDHEDQYMHMVVAKFLQQSTPHVSVARGGFIEMWRMLGGRTNQVMEDFDLERCKSLYEDYPTPVVATSDTSNSNPPSDGSDSEGLTSHYRQRLQQKSSKLYSSLSLGWRDKSQRLRVKFGEMWQYRQASTYKDNPVPLTDTKTGRRYRNLPDVFVVGDEDESEDIDTSNPLVNISLYSTSPEISYSFPCEEISSSNEALSSHLLLTATEMIVLREAPDKAGWGRVKYREGLTTILKITAKKKDMNVIIFRLGEVEDGEAVVSKVIKLRITNSRKATDAVQQLLGRINT